MSDARNTPIYGHYNARSVDPRRVAQRFVAPPQFWRIVPEGNSVLTGPRGSGKTTLLKMLEAPALEVWDDPRAEQAREAVTYSGVFVPADRSWSGQVDAMASHLDPDLRSAIGLASFTLHVLRALSACAAQRVTPSDSPISHDRVTLAPGDEEEIANAMWQAWGLSEPVGSFRGLRYKLSDDLATLGRLTRRARRDEHAQENLRQHPALDLDPIEAMGPFIDRFNDAADQPAHVWMLLIDEIEFLPPFLSTDILQHMRGRDPRILLKVSLAPYTAVSPNDDEPLGGWADHDYKRIDLTFSDKEQGYTFSDALVRADLQRRGIGMTPEEYLGGPGEFEAETTANAYGPKSSNQAHIKSLADKDESFRKWLDRSGIDPRNAADTASAERAKTLRKAKPIILLRDEFLRSADSDGEQRRSRKQPTTYVGALSAYAICENNPRLLSNLLERFAILNESGALTPTRRAEAIENAAQQYELHLRALTLPALLPAEFLPRPLVRKIGEHFEKQVLGPEFDPEPALSFTISQRDLEKPGLSAVVQQLIHYGAFVPTHAERSEQFRLAHMFAPLFHLPLRKGRPHALSGVLGLDRISPQMTIEDAEAGT